MVKKEPKRTKGSLISRGRESRMTDLLKRKPMKALLAEAHEHGAHSLKRELGPVSADRR